MAWLWTKIEITVHKATKKKTAKATQAFKMLAMGERRVQFIFFKLI
jgi:hypothetical protein